MNFLKTKYLTPICLLIFLMPFLRMCDSSMEKIESVETEYTNNIHSVNTEDPELMNNDEGEILTKNMYVTKNKEFNLNAYQLGGAYFKAVFEAEILKDKEFYSLISYSFIILFSVLMIVFSWLKKYLWVRNLAIVNISLLIISTLLLVKSEFIDEFDDIKYGLYVFLFYSILIIFTSQNEQNKLKLNES